MRTDTKQAVARTSASPALHLAAITAAFVLAGCAEQQKPIAPNDRNALSSQVVIAVHIGPHLGFMIEGAQYATVSALISPLAAKLAGMDDGRVLRGDLGLEDPIALTKERLLRALRPTLALRDVLLVAEPQKNDPSDGLRQAHPSGVMLDLRTTGWGLQDNRVRYQAQARLVRLADSHVLWEATCKPLLTDGDMASAGREALAANHGELLKAKLSQAAAGCADELASSLVRGKSLLTTKEGETS
jgi:hypothetical protein